MYILDEPIEFELLSKPFGRRFECDDAAMACCLAEKLAGKAFVDQMAEEFEADVQKRFEAACLKSVDQPHSGYTSTTFPTNFPSCMISPRAFGPSR